MATSKEYLVFILEQLSEIDGITYRSMMGEYIIFHTDIDTDQKTNGIRYVPMKFKK